jgi:hypothetical protein
MKHIPYKHSSYDEFHEWKSPLLVTKDKMNNRQQPASEKTSELFKEMEEWSRYLAGQLGFSLPDQIECANISNLVPQLNLQCDIRDAPASNNDETFILDWNRDRIPKGVKNMSDWSLKVYNGSVTKIYELHKTILSFGPRRSMFFIKEFEEGRHRLQSGVDVTSASVSEVALPEKAASFMPQLLDYIYRDELDLNTHNAVALKFLANYFDVRPLFTTTISFIENDISSSTALIYMEDADLLKDKDLANIALKLVAESFAELSLDSLITLSPILFQRLVSHSAIMCTPEHLSEIIASYIRYHPLEMNHELFFLLTNANVLPRVSSNEAFWYLSYGSDTFRGILVDETFGGSQGSLKGRCMFAITSQWRNSLLPAVGASLDQRGSVSQIEKYKAYRNLPSDIKIELLEYALISAGAENNSTSCLQLDSTNPVRMDLSENRDDINDDFQSRKHNRNDKTIKKKYQPVFL